SAHDSSALLCVDGSPPGAGIKSALTILNFAKQTAGYVVDEATDPDRFRNPGVGAKFLQLMADIFINVLEGVEERGSDSRGPGPVLDSGAQIVLGGQHQTTISVIDDHKFLGAEEIVRNHEGT